MHVSCYRRFQVIDNPGSRSQAENINYALKFVTASPGAVVAIFDADHHPVSSTTCAAWLKLHIPTTGAAPIGALDHGSHAMIISQ